MDKGKLPFGDMVLKVKEAGGKDRESNYILVEKLKEEKDPEKYLAALEELASLYPWAFSYYLARQYSQCARKHYDAGGIGDAAAMYERSVSMYEDTYDDEYETPPEILNVLWNLSVVYETMKLYEKSIETISKGLEYSEMYAKIDDYYSKYVSDFKNALEEYKESNNK